MILLDGEPIPFSTYPNGETVAPGSWLRDVVASGQDWPTVEWRYHDDGEFLQLALVKQGLDRLGARPTLHIRYMPYSRMDRAPGRSDIFSLKTAAAMINVLGFEHVLVDEPHSDVTMALLDNAEANCTTLDLLGDVLEMIGFRETDWLFFPDAGAQKRYLSLAGYRSAVGFKHRDFATGALTGHLTVALSSFDAPRWDGTEKVLILDDLCSRGGTFVMAADRLREMGFGSVYLLVAHCEETMWGGDLLDHIDGLFTTDSIFSEPKARGVDHPKVHVYSEGKWV